MRFAIGHGPKGEHDPELLLASHPSHWQYASLPVGGLQSGHWQAIVGKTATRRLAHRLLAMLEPKWIRNIYIYIYILDSHMAPYGACEVAQSTARSKAQFEAERFRRGSRRKNMHGRKCFRRKKKHARAMLSKAQWPQSTFEQCFRVLSGLEGKRSMLEH
jgi:hypothetical protein